MVTYPKDWIEGKLTDYLRPVPFFKYLKEPNIVGLYPVIQQGEIPIVGFSNGSAYENFSNIILFGDHTLSLYKPTKKFFVATDGVKILDCKGIDRDFAYYWLSNNMPKSEGYKRHFSIIKNLALTIPHSVGEQQAIADTLSTFDEHIENLTELIEKKKVIRDGALEDLVTGKVRLDEFDGEWETVEFSRYFRKMKNNTFPRDNLTDNGDIGNIHYGDVLIKFGPVLDDEKVIPRVKPSVSITNPDYLQENDIVIADTAEDETVGKAVQIGSISIPLVSGLHTIPCRPNFETAPGFLGYYINSNAYHSQLLPHITGIKVSSVSKKSIDTTYLHIPKDIKEQQAIASVLTAMDEELDNLELEKEKLLQMKAGAMDDLLTGKIRLV